MRYFVLSPEKLARILNLGHISVWTSHISGAHSIATGGLVATMGDRSTEVEDSRVSLRAWSREISGGVAVAQVRGNMGSELEK